MTIFKKNKAYLFIYCIFFVFLFVICSTKSWANTGFTYELKFPDNQMDQSLNYYKLMMEPGQEQELSIVLSNTGNETIVVELNLNGAKTNRNGVIEWTNASIKNDDSLKFPFTDIVSGPSKVELAGGESREVKFSVKMPETSYEGVIAGGLQLVRANQEDDASQSNGAQVVNRYAYAVAFLLQESEKELTPDLKYNSTYAGQSNYRNSIFINLSNTVATFLNDLTVEAQITNQGSKQVLYEAKTTSMRMAPNSFLEFPVSMNGEQMQSGKYTATILATSGEQRWEWTEDFEISESEAKKFNERDVGLVQEKGFDWMLIVWIVAGFVVTVILVFVILRFIRKNKEKNNKKMQRIKKERANSKNMKKRN